MGRSNIRVAVISFLFTFLPTLLFAQELLYFVSFTSKYPSNYSIQKPESFLSKRAIERRVKNAVSVSENDLPVSSFYLDSLEYTGARIESTSKWFNGAFIHASHEQVNIILGFSFVKDIHHVVINSINPNSSILSGNPSIPVIDYGLSYNQIKIPGVDVMHGDNIFGNGVLVAVIDNGFKNVNTLPAFDSLHYHNRVIGTYDFVNNEVNVYNDGDGHGTHVFSIIGGYSKGNLIGAAWQANFLLLRSENDAIESIQEEIDWVRAAEYADSAGADIISSSLGYNQFDNASENHTYSDLTGDKTIITKGADIAASKGILVISAAGNEGAQPWKYLLAPADGDSVLAVGGVDVNGEPVSSSSFGPTYDGRIKPDVVTLSSTVRVAAYLGGYSSGGGTSYAAPAIAGLAAGLWQRYPHLTSMELMDYIKVSSSQYFNPDNKKGYGIPNYKRAAQLIEASNSISVYPNPTSDGQLHLYWSAFQKNEEVEVMFYTVTGQLMAEEKLTITNPILPLSTNIQSWERGIYFLQVISSSRRFTIRVVRF